MNAAPVSKAELSAIVAEAVAAAVRSTPAPQLLDRECKDLERRVDEVLIERESRREPSLFDLQPFAD